MIRFTTLCSTVLFLTLVACNGDDPSGDDDGGSSGDGGGAQAGSGSTSGPGVGGGQTGAGGAVGSGSAGSTGSAGGGGGITPACETCLVASCPTAYDNCNVIPGCMEIFECILPTGCGSFTECTTACAGVMDMYGGPQAIAASIALEVYTCVVVSCPGDCT